jgi:hypothetical protein
MGLAQRGFGQGFSCLPTTTRQCDLPRVLLHAVRPNGQQQVGPVLGVRIEKGEYGRVAVGVVGRIGRKVLNPVQRCHVQLGLTTRQRLSQLCQERIHQGIEVHH